MIARPQIVLPRLSSGMIRDARREASRRDGRFHPTFGIGVVLEPDGTVAKDGFGEWNVNALINEGEQDVCNTWLLGTTILAKYLALLKGAAPAETDTMAFLAGATNGEILVPPTGGYSRQLIATTDWGAPVLNAGDYQTTAAQKTFGANSSGSSWLVTSVSMVTAATGQTSGSGKHLVSTPTSAQPTTIAVGQSFLWTQTCMAQ